MTLRPSLNVSLTILTFVRRVLFTPGWLAVFYNKPWINKDIKVRLNRKKKAFMDGYNGNVQKEIQRELRRELRRAQDYCKNRIGILHTARQR